MTALIDPRAPRFGAAITSGIAIVGFADAFTSFGPISTVASLTLLVLFVWSVFLPGSHPYKFLFGLIRPRIGEPKELEDARPPRFAQQVGLFFAITASVGLLLASQSIVAIALAFIFIAAFLNAFFNFCLGCQMYLVLKRFGLFSKGN
ncbi:MAG: DUF4395 family protein [Actinobacteria bacterium]|uniref:Unannotated protein n=1 Tax=freshwater metagenome TaxID=449393 RepID=A0A6J6EAF1_9ZZZZ|nr:DUF4395 family protein [Actinomycetota bacterium]MTA90026.1 DUF4395 family protein [Actinomycetota bacterium]